VAYEVIAAIGTIGGCSLTRHRMSMSGLTINVCSVYPDGLTKGLMNNMVWRRRQKGHDFRSSTRPFAKKSFPFGCHWLHQKVARPSSCKPTNVAEAVAIVPWKPCRRLGTPPSIQRGAKSPIRQIMRHTGEHQLANCMPANGSRAEVQKRLMFMAVASPTV
jgi:hypothetical protein